MNHICNCICALLLLTGCFNLKPVANNDVRLPASSDLSRFDGDYELMSRDSLIRTADVTLGGMAYEHTYIPDENDWVNLTKVSSRRIRVKIFKNDTLVHTRMIKGRQSGKYFQFELLKVGAVKPLYVILNYYSLQKNRIALTESGDLKLDTAFGGQLLLLILPSFGTSAELYNVIYKRKQ